MALSGEWKIALVVGGVVAALVAIWLLGNVIFNLGGTTPGTGTGEILTSTEP